MLILGKSDRSPAVLKYFETYEACHAYYGDGTISDAYYTARFIGAPHIFTMSFQKYSDLTQCADILKQQDIAYIVPVDLFASEFYNNPYRGNVKTYYVQYLLEQMQDLNSSVLIVTDKKADLYKDMPSFVTDMSGKITALKKAFRSNVDLSRFVFTDNNLESYDWANVILAAALCIADIPDYPQITDVSIGNAVWEISHPDIPDEQVYFQNHYLIPTSIENLLNFAPASDIKLVPVFRILTYISRELDFSQFLGKFYSDYQKAKIKDRLTKYMEGWVGWIIDDYTIESVSVEQTQPNAVRVVLRYKVQPKYTAEWFQGEVVL